LFWAEELASQTEDAEFAVSYTTLAKALRENEAKISEELRSVQGQPAGSAVTNPWTRRR
jgi:isocitrate dehydrogenase